MSFQFAIASSHDTVPSGTEQKQSATTAAAFSEAIRDCQDVLRHRGQIVVIADVRVPSTAPVPPKPFARLLADAIRDISSVSCRSASLSVDVQDATIVIRSDHPLELPGRGLEVDETLRLAAQDLGVAMEFAWDQGRGPRLTLTLPAQQPASGAVGAAGGRPRRRPGTPNR
jgi:hypothetical protein